MSPKETYSSIASETVEDAKVMVEVIAPATLKAGYTFDAQYEGVTFPVVVPEGGVVQGQKLIVPFDPKVSYESTTATGAWKDGLCDCARYGIFHPTFINALCCPLILLGQVMTRLKLDWLARPASDEDFKKTFKITVGIFIVYTLFGMFFSPSIDVSTEVDDDRIIAENDNSVYNFVNFIYGVFLVVVMTVVRKMVREKYQIPEQRCIGCEDFCCAFWCSCCTVSQLARQTADYDVNEGAFFTNDGLAQTATSPVLIV